jgi:hypothetical protein
MRCSNFTMEGGKGVGRPQASWATVGQPGDRKGRPYIYDFVVPMVGVVVDGVPMQGHFCYIV